MKLRNIWYASIIFSAIMAVILMTGSSLQVSGTEENLVKEACLKATIRAVEMEIAKYEQKLAVAKEGSGNADNITRYNTRIAELKEELTKYRALKADSYVLPEKKAVSVLVKQVYQEGSMLELENMSKSGPFYHLVGIRGGDYKVFRVNQRYTLTIYLVHKRDYVFPLAVNYYVYVDQYTASFSLNPRQLGEEILEELSLKQNTVTIRVKSNGYTDKNSFQADVKKVAGIEEKIPHYILTFHRIKVDEGKAFLIDGVLLTFDLKKDLGINGNCTISVKNKVIVKP